MSEPRGRGKCKYKTLTVVEKEKNHEKNLLYKDEKFCDLAVFYGVRFSTTYDIKKNHYKIEGFVKGLSSKGSDRKVLKGCEYKMLCIHDSYQSVTKTHLCWESLIMKRLHFFIRHHEKSDF